MTKTQMQKLAGAFFVFGALLVNILYALLMINFEYPDILRRPAGEILTRFHAGGTGLILTWLAFAWVGVPILFAIIMLQKIVERDDAPYLWVGTFAGVIGALAQMIGLLRWVFVVPLLAKTYTDPTATAAAKEAAAVAFQVVHQYGGVIIGEHIGQIFTIFWLVAVSVAIRKSDRFKPWLAWAGHVIAVVYILAQTELLSTVFPGFPAVPAAGLVGSLMCLVWMVILGLFLMRGK